MSEIVSRIRSGGQSGADRGAMDAARERGAELVGWVPKGGWAEDMPEPPGVLARYPEMEELDSSDPATRTERNVTESDATVIVGDAGHSPGTMLTIEIAKRSGKPFMLTEGKSATDVLAWLSGAGRELDVNVAGPRESEQPGIYKKAYALVRGILEEQERAK